MSDDLRKLNYSERLLIRQALEAYAIVLNAPPATESKLATKKEAERLQWLFKDAEKIVVHE